MSNAGSFATLEQCNSEEIAEYSLDTRIKSSFEIRDHIRIPTQFKFRINPEKILPKTTHHAVCMCFSRVRFQFYSFTSLTPF